MFVSNVVPVKVGVGIVLIVLKEEEVSIGVCWLRDWYLELEVTIPGLENPVDEFCEGSPVELENVDCSDEVSVAKPDKEVPLLRLCITDV